MPSRSYEQMSLRFPDPPGVSCAAGREEPALWVRRVAIWHDVANPPVRNFQLKRGLNIIYSPTGDDPDALATGHAAGKTMFCRFIRYCMGEDAFADPEDTVEIRRKFPLGAVGVEFRIRGQTWIIRRPFASREDLALQAESFDALTATSVQGEFGVFLEAVENASFDRTQRKLLAEMDDVDDAWQYILAWLTRDQECRIGGLLHWRHKDSSTRSSVRTANENTRLNVLRVALGLYSKVASDARKATAAAAARCEELRKEAQRAERHFEGVRDELARAFDVGPERIWSPPTELLQNEAVVREAHQAALMELADQRIRETPALSTNASLVDLQDRQKAGLSAFSTAKLQRWFDYLIRRVVSPEAKGWIVLDGNGLHPRIDWRGRRRSVALNSLQIVLFDLAAMLCAVEGDAPCPAFLIHDSPREGDLDPHTYARVFHAIHELGEDEDGAPFQYIVTTTTNPPSLVQGRVRLTIAADSAQNRLLMEDL